MIALALEEDDVALWSACQDGLRPDSSRTLTQWADAKRRLSSKGAAEPGEWHTSRTPYLRDIMDALSACMWFQQVVVKKGSQVGVTEVALNWVGETVDEGRVPIILMLPNVKPAAEKFVKQKLDPMIDETPSVRAKIKDRRSRDGGNTTYMKDFPGGSIMVVGSESAAGLRSQIAARLVMDEVDGYAMSADDEGDPPTLAARALRTYGKRKKSLEISTPKLDGSSRITRDYESCDVQLLLHVPCPFCKAMQVLAHENLEWPEGEPEKAAFRCIECEVLIPEQHKTWMLANHEWRIRYVTAEGGELETPAPAREPAGPLPLDLEISAVLREAHDRGATSIGFDLPAYYSPEGWWSWADSADLWEKAEADTTGSLKQIYDNTVRGVAHKRSTDAPEHQRLYDRREHYPIGIVPSPRVLFLTCGVDIQKGRIEWEIMGWGRGKESWSIDYDVIYGSIVEPRAARALDEVLMRDVPCADGSTLPVHVMGIDTGYDAENLYPWIRRHVQPAYGANGASCWAPRTVAAVKGRDHGPRLVWSTSRDDIGGQWRGVRIYQVSSFIAASELYTFLRLNLPTDEEAAAGVLPPPGYCHFPQYNAEYFKQLVADRCVTKIVRGYPRETFELPNGLRNEAHDCRKYGRAAADLYGISRFNELEWRTLEAARGIVHGEEQGMLPLDGKVPVEERGRIEHGPTTYPEISAGVPQPHGVQTIVQPESVWEYAFRAGGQR